MPARMKRLIGTVTPNSSTVFRGRTDGACLPATPNHRSTTPWVTSRTPIDAAILASGDVARSGRKTRSSVSAPNASETRRAMATAAAVGNSGPKNPDRSAQNAYAESIATEPTARLMIPEPRYVSTTPRAMPAISAPDPSPSSANSTYWSMSAQVGRAAAGGCGGQRLRPEPPVRWSIRLRRSTSSNASVPAAGRRCFELAEQPPVAKRNVIRVAAASPRRPRTGTPRGGCRTSSGCCTAPAARDSARSRRSGRP